MSMPSSVGLARRSCAASRVWSATSAACSRALVGMQPRCRQVPPSLSFSTRATRQAELGGAQRAGVAAAAAPEDDDVIGGLGGGRHPGAPLLWRGSWRRRGVGRRGRCPASCHCRGLRRTPTAVTRGHAGPASCTGSRRPIVSAWRGGDAVAAKRAPHGGGDLASARAHFADFIATRRGVEAYVEPATNITRPRSCSSPTTASGPGGRCPRAPAALRGGPHLDIPVYDVNLTGYPARMRAVDTRQRRPRALTGTAPTQRRRTGIGSERPLRLRGWGDPSRRKDHHVSPKKPRPAVDEDVKAKFRAALDARSRTGRRRLRPLRALQGRPRPRPRGQRDQQMFRRKSGG